MNKHSLYHVDLNLTDKCNFRCIYCTEAGTDKRSYDISDQTVNNFINFIYKLLESDFFKKNYTHVSIGFWGGEPTLKMNIIKQILNEFKNLNTVCFNLFTNRI